MALRCPNPLCHSERTYVLRTETDSEDASYMPAQYRGKNLTRRRKACKACGKKWWTIEIVQEAFDLLNGIGRLETYTGTVKQR